VQLFSDLTRGLYVILGSIIGLRLLLLYRHSRQLPELLMAVCLISGGVIYNGGAWAWQRTGFPPAEYAALISGLLRPMLALSALCVAVFAWKTSRRTAAWAPVLVVLLTLALLLWIVDGWFSDPTINQRGVPWMSRSFALLLCYVWGAVESFLYYRNAKRQGRVGLPTDPLVTNRAFFLGLSFATFAVFWLASILFDVLARPAPLGILGVTGTLRVIGLWLAFLPPAALSSWLLRRAGAQREAQT
jgi:hypothetical protein